MLFPLYNFSPQNRNKITLLGDKAAGGEADYLPLSSTDIKDD
jgi:hypothetical protein